MNLFKLSASYLRQRPFSSVLNVLILALGIATIVVLLLVSDRVEQNLTRNAEGIDLVVGAKGSPLQLILSAVYHIDAPTGNTPVAEAEALIENPAVAEAMPLALGDSYRGFRIVGATPAYAAHYGGEAVRGRLWSGAMEATLGAVAAREAGLDVGDTFYSAHGLSAGGEAHEEHPDQGGRRVRRDGDRPGPPPLGEYRDGVGRAWRARGGRARRRARRGGPRRGPRGRPCA